MSLFPSKSHLEAFDLDQINKDRQTRDEKIISLVIIIFFLHRPISAHPYWWLINDPEEC